MNKRDEIREQIKSTLASNTDKLLIKKGFTDVVAEAIVESLDVLVERWTDEETAEDVTTGDRVHERDEYVGMRFRVNGWHEDNSPEFVGATGTVVKDDRDGAPGVKFDAPWDHLNDLKDHPDIEGGYTYFGVDRMEKVEE